MTARASWRHSLFLRLFAIGAVIALVAVVAATWATVRSTTVAVHQQRQESLHSEATTYDALLGYAATHTSWSGARTLVVSLARQAGETVSVTNGTGQVLVSSAAGDRRGRPVRLLPVDASATLNPLDVDRALLAASSLPSTQTAEGATVSCGHAQCAHLVAPVTAIDARAKGPFDAVSRMAYAELLERTDGCLRHMGLRPVTTIEADFAVSVDYAGHDNQVATCVESSRKAMLRAYVAPPSLLFVGSGSPEARAFWVLSGRNKLRIVLVASAILAVTFILCALLAAYVVRPLRVMAATAARAADGDLAARVPVSRHDEVGQVAHAFNQMADRREQLEEARRRMVADVSHELRTPLANIGGWIEAAQDGLASRDDELLATLHDETMTLQRLVEDLQQLSLGDVGELRIEPTAIDTSVFVEQLAASMRPGAEAAGITLATDARSGMTLEADPFRLRQAVGNLVANAIRHSAPGGSITIAAGPATISVRDTGEGIPPADLPHVMERFRRSDSSRSRATGGSGLGLAIVRQIVEAHGGHVEIESVPGHGTTVALFFPNP